jgi:imidazolonepropionase
VPAIACATLVTCAFERVPVRGRARPEVVRDAVLAWDEGRIVHAGARVAWDGDVDEDLGDRAIVPGFVDCHTHLPFAEWRDDEYEARLQGATYRDLHGEGGIQRSARMLAEASDDEVLAFSRGLLAEMLGHGTTALELKTGYGLSVDAEVRQAKLARRLAAETRQTARVTLLACHAVPEGTTREGWVETVRDRLLRRAARQRLADAVDVYVEDIAFTVEDLARVAEAARAFGLPVRCHADQLGASGAAEAAEALGARSADHLNHVSPEGVEALGRGTTAAVLLPTSTLLLGAQPPPVDALLDAGAAIALATDLNPGTSAVASMPEAIAVGCALYRIEPLMALVAATINPAWVLGLDAELGSLEPGKRADFVVLDAPEFRAVPYRPGHNPVVETYLAGEPARRQ